MIGVQLEPSTVYLVEEFGDGVAEWLKQFCSRVRILLVQVQVQASHSQVKVHLQNFKSNFCKSEFQIFQVRDKSQVRIRIADNLFNNYNNIKVNKFSLQSTISYT